MKLKKYIKNIIFKSNILFQMYFLYKKNTFLYLTNAEKRKLLKSIPLGLNTEKRKQKIIISLTTFPSRIDNVYYTIYSLLDQTYKADKVILWLSKEEFGDDKKFLLHKLKRLENFGLEIRWCENLKSYNKLLPALECFENEIIITADDDIYYSNKLVELLYKGYINSDRESIICHRAHKIIVSNNKIEKYTNWIQCIKGPDKSYYNFLTGVGGVLYPPHILYKDISNKKLIKKLCPIADDIWFWSMAVLNNKKIEVIRNNISNLKYVDLKKEIRGKDTLASKNIVNNKNDKQIKAVLDYYPTLYSKLLLKE